MVSQHKEIGGGWYESPPRLVYGIHVDQEQKPSKGVGAIESPGPERLNAMAGGDAESG